MARYTGPKNRIARRFGANIFGRLRNPLLHKPNPPGMHGAKRRKKSEYALQLEEMQKLRAFYGMLSRSQLLRYYREAIQKSGNTQEYLAQLLETRLDAVVQRLYLGKTPFQAHQLVSHGHIRVNGKKVDIRSFHVKPGMEISLKDRAKEFTFVKQNQELLINHELPTYLSWNPSTMTGELVSMPGVDQIPFTLPINISLVCEFLSRAS
ncbi:MAG: 30S ribosomal protein S4 [Chlamydiales bacterium]